jgi:hypothetical protein
VEHVFHAIFVLSVGFLSHFHKTVNFVAVVLVSFVDGVHGLENLLCGFGFLLNSFELDYHLFNGLNGLIIVLKLILVEFLIGVSGCSVIHGFLCIRGGFTLS